MKRSFIIFYLMLALFIVGCTTKSNIDKVIPALDLGTTEIILKQKEQVILPIDSNLDEEDISFSIENEDIVTIDNTTIEGKEIGQTTIYISLNANDSQIGSFIVIVEATNVKTPVLTTPSNYISVNKSTALMFLNKDEVGASLNSFNWTISDEKIASISDDFIVTGHKVGTVTIYATLKSDPTITVSYELTVTKVDNPDKRLLLYTNDLTATVNAGEYIEIFIEGQNSKDNFYFKSYNNQIATVGEIGNVAGVKPGVAKIAAFSRETDKIYGVIYVTVVGTPNVNYAERIIDVALSQIGYVEGRNNDTKYGSWYNMNHNEWCAMFVSWVANEAGITTTIIPKYASVSWGKEWFENQGLFKYKNNYTPKPGDIIFFLSNGASHTGIVVKVEGQRVYTIEGNTSDKVAERNYFLTNSTITGYGTPKYPPYSN